MPASVEIPVAQMASTSGMTLPAKRSASKTCASRPSAAACRALRGLPSLAPCAFRWASAERVRSPIRRSVGLLASSGAVRLIGDGVPPAPRSSELDAIGHWFLKPYTDFRSSGALELPMSEFGCQGLELDYAGLCWGGDLIWSGTSWTPRMMRAPRWQIIRELEKQRFCLNGYRVLLTRGRAGSIIFVPRSNLDDPTRPPQEADAIAQALTAAGCSPI
jgi:hypothetical protein